MLAFTYWKEKLIPFLTSAISSFDFIVLHSRPSQFPAFFAMDLHFAESTPPTTPNIRPTPIDPNFGPTRLTHRSASVAHTLDDNVVPPLGLPPYDLLPLGLPPYDLPPFDLQPFNLQPFDLQPFGLPPFELPPFGLQPFVVPPLELPPFGLQPFVVPLLRCVVACHCRCNSQYRTPEPEQTRCDHCRRHTPEPGQTLCNHCRHHTPEPGQTRCNHCIRHCILQRDESESEGDD